jgi:hypothetical protein
MKTSGGVRVRRRVRRTVIGVTVRCLVTQQGLTVTGVGRGAGSGGGNINEAGGEMARGGGGEMAMMMTQR